MADSTPSTTQGHTELAGREFVFTEEQGQLRAAVRKFCADHIDENAVRAQMTSDPAFDAKIWTRLGSELGVLGMSVPETAGGVGGTLIDQAVAVEQLGAALACGPLLGTVYLAIPALVASSQPGDLLAPLIEGTRTAAFAVPDDAARFEPSAVTVDATGADGGWILNGTVPRVVDAGSADVILVAANAPDGPGLYAVETTDTAVQRIPLTTLDLTRRQATVGLVDAPARLVAGPAEAQRVIDHAFQVGAALLAVEQVGATQHLLDLTVDYARSRLQFGRPIGSFQAVKHRLADDLVALEHARSTAYHAVWALTDGSDDPALAVSIAQATCSAALLRVANDTIQVHGGIGFTWEHQAHLYYKRAYTDAALLGGAEQHRARVAELVLDIGSEKALEKSLEKDAPRVATGLPS
ncbi:acyl-CoA dehydrogenase family protein [Mycobacterium sp. smrl_JER01]|uniref:acyl-CoA dehydrogenase family protein n=1 Tax=Mycobacterium sp. smrl_JER01 TaxID=3402633 RepID=UPI003ACA61B7